MGVRCMRFLHIVTPWRLEEEYTTMTSGVVKFFFAQEIWQCLTSVFFVYCFKSLGSPYDDYFSRETRRRTPQATYLRFCTVILFFLDELLTNWGLFFYLFEYARRWRMLEPSCDGLTELAICMSLPYCFVCNRLTVSRQLIFNLHLWENNKQISSVSREYIAVGH